MVVITAAIDFLARRLDRIFQNRGSIARIPETEIDRLKRELAVERLARARGWI